jgi:hypothetical protein
MANRQVLRRALARRMADWFRHLPELPIQAVPNDEKLLQERAALGIGFPPGLLFQPVREVLQRRLVNRRGGQSELPRIHAKTPKFAVVDCSAQFVADLFHFAKKGPGQII